MRQLKNPITDRQHAPNIANMVAKLRRLRTEVALLLQQIDDALVRVEGTI